MANQVSIQGVPIHIGDTIRVYYKIIEHEVQTGKAKKEKKEEVKERLQPYEGVVIGIRGEGDNKTFTVRRVGADGIGIERIFPVISPWIKKIVVKKKGKVKRAKLTYLRKNIQSKIKTNSSDAQKQSLASQKG